MEVWPLRFREVAGRLLFGDEAGGWFWGTEPFLHRYGSGALIEDDARWLLQRGHAFQELDDLDYVSFQRRWANRHAAASPGVGYLILVPTLRCNLTCDYCQVSRASEAARGFDWSEETLGRVLEFIATCPGPSIKIEFQGGEPLLRLDLLQRVRTYVRERFEAATFVVCSNFQSVSAEAWAFFDDDDTFLSTSIDGDVDVQARQRSHSVPAAEAFFSNVQEFVRRFGNTRISALPTIDMRDPVAPDVLLDTYLSHGLSSIYLRPVNWQGFARRGTQPTADIAPWRAYHRRFIELLIECNASGTVKAEEFYFTHILRRILRGAGDNHVDLRNPNRVADGYLVVDYDGRLYPSDEARMMARVGQIDLSLGHVSDGIDHSKVDALNHWGFNDLDPDCIHCPYQPFCGTDVIDDISRYGRVDLPRHDTWFCQRHLALFDLAFELLSSTDPKVQNSVALWTGTTIIPEEWSEVRS